MTNATVLITGATGFIGHHIVDKLLVRGYDVIGISRSEAKYLPLLKSFKEKYPDARLSFEVVSDISSENALGEILSGHPEIKHVIHTASPHPEVKQQPVSQDESSCNQGLSLEETYLKPAVDGILNILNAIRKFSPQVTNVVFTSSMADMLPREGGSSKVTLTNRSWNPITKEEIVTERDAYAASKKYAEYAARKFCEEEKPNFKVATVNPPLVLGPLVFDNSVSETMNSSNEILNIIVHLDSTSVEPQVFFPIISVDVRDVAEFHVLALENDKLAEERIAIAASPFIAQRVLNILNDCFPELRGKICKGDYHSVDQLEKDMCIKFDFSSTLDKIGGYKFIPLEESVNDVFRQYLAKYRIC